MARMAHVTLLIIAAIQSASAARLPETETLEPAHDVDDAECDPDLSPWVTPWNIDQWKAPAQGYELGNLSMTMVDCIMAKNMASAMQEKKMSRMRDVTGMTKYSEDIFYMWTSTFDGMGVNIVGATEDSQTPPVLKLLGLQGNYDPVWETWVVTLSELHNTWSAAAKNSLKESEAGALPDLEEDLQKYAVKEMATDGDFANGVSMVPFPKFGIVSAWLKKHFPTLVEACGKMGFFRRPGTDPRKSFIQIKVHPTSLLFGKALLVNPEYKKPDVNELRDNLPDGVKDNIQFAVEIIRQKKDPFPNGLAGKLSLDTDGSLKIIPMAPMGVKLFDPSDDGNNPNNAYDIYKNSHPDVMQDGENVRNLKDLVLMTAPTPKTPRSEGRKGNSFVFLPYFISLSITMFDTNTY